MGISAEEKDKEAGRLGDGETRRQGDNEAKKETRREGGSLLVS
jgi:hypothetical protein